MQVTQLHRYPVKSLLGEALESVQLGPNGFAGDRAWALRHQGVTLSGKKFPAMMSAQARFTDEPTVEHGSAAVEITLPDGSQIHTAESAASARLSAWLDHPAKLWPLVDASELDVFRRKASSATTAEELDAELRAVFSRLPEEPLPDLASFPAELMEYDSPPGTWFDAYPLLLVSDRAVQTLSANAPNNFDLRRFRPNIILSGWPEDDTGGFPENALVGKQCRIGDTVLSVELRCPRCIMTTHPLAELPKDPGIMRALVQQNTGDLGVYARVISGGTITTGDSLEILDA